MSPGGSNVDHADPKRFRTCHLDSAPRSGVLRHRNLRPTRTRRGAASGVLRRNVGPGRIELVEVTVGGDTVWHRSVVLPVVPLSPERRDEAIERFAQQAMAASQRTGDPLTPAVARELAEGAVYLPDHLPAVALVPTTFGEVWILTAESARGLSVWYSLARGDNESAPRRVLLPSSFSLRDATPTHVWGVRADPATDAERVIGLRLVEPSGGGWQPVDKIPPAFERRCIRAGSLRSSLLLGRTAVLFPLQSALPARRLAALGARAD